MDLIKAYACSSKILYFSSELARVLLKNAMGYSVSCFPFYNKNLAMLFSDANIKTKNYFEKSTLINTGAWVSAFLISSNDCFASTLHLISAPFFSILVIDLKIWANFEMNLLKKLTFLRKDWISFLFLGRSTFWMELTLFGSIFIPYFDIICLRKFP